MYCTKTLKYNNNKKSIMRKIIILYILFLFIISCTGHETVVVDRESTIPSDAIKITPETDANPVKSLTAEYSDPVPVLYPISTAGAEDSPFIMPDGNTIYFFFTPDVRIPAEKQVIDSVTGIYVSHKQGDSWTKPERVVLQDNGKLSLDGCFFAKDNYALFCSAREGYTGIHWFSAEYVDNIWQNWENADDVVRTAEYNTGELHIFNDELYFHAKNSDGNNDLWISKKVNGEWSQPENVAAMNTASDEGYPALNPQGTELWFSRDYAVWRSKKVNEQWQQPERMFSPLAGEPSIDTQGNVYFVHHYFSNNVMIEADIYVASKTKI
jgi:hypothetical protein